MSIGRFVKFMVHILRYGNGLSKKKGKTMNALKKNGLIMALMLVCINLASSNLLAQKKILKAADDGFKWYKLEQNGNVGALNTKDITLIPLSRAYTFINYNPSDGGWFGIEKNGKKGACDKNGREVIPPKYKSVIYSSSEKVFKYEKDSGDWVTTDISLENGNSAPPHMPTGKINGNDNNSVSTANTSKLLYQGIYKIQGTKAKDLINGLEVGSNFDATEKVEIYEDKMTVYFGTLCKYKLTNKDGERVYEGIGTVGGGKVTAYVSQNYKIRLTNETEINGTHMLIEIPVIKGRSLMQNYHP